MNLLGEDGMNIMPYMFSWRMLNEVKILPAMTEYNGKATEIPHE